MIEGDKLYTVTRRDMPAGYQAVQSCHAYMEFSLEYPKLTRRWHDVSNYMGLLSVENERQLFDLYEAAVGAGVKCVPFYEPDVNWEMTALTLEPGAATVELVESLPLALREFKKRSK